MSLHACDTATDEAIAQGIRWQGSVILAAPCCQHELHDQVQHPDFQPVLRHGILKQRTADILTDTFRALVLRIMGYKYRCYRVRLTGAHLAGTLLIRAVKTQAPGDSAAVQEYARLKQFWNVTPYLEELLGDVLAPYLADRITARIHQEGPVLNTDLKRRKLPLPGERAGVILAIRRPTSGSVPTVGQSTPKGLLQENVVSLGSTERIHARV